VLVDLPDAPLAEVAGQIREAVPGAEVLEIPGIVRRRPSTRWRSGAVGRKLVEHRARA